MWWVQALRTDLAELSQPLQTGRAQGTHFPKKCLLRCHITHHSTSQRCWCLGSTQHPRGQAVAEGAGYCPPIWRPNGGDGTRICRVRSPWWGLLALEVCRVPQGVLGLCSEEKSGGSPRLQALLQLVSPGDVTHDGTWEPSGFELEGDNESKEDRHPPPRSPVGCP